MQTRTVAAWAVLAVTILAIGPAHALQCYRRAYSDAHLAEQPDQVIELLEWAWRHEGDAGPQQVPGRLRVRFRDHPDPFTVFIAYLTCSAVSAGEGHPPGSVVCVEMDLGGEFVAVWEENDTVMIHTDEVIVRGGEGPGGGPEERLVADLNTLGTRYRLHAVDPATCAHP